MSYEPSYRTHRPAYAPRRDWRLVVIAVAIVTGLLLLVLLVIIGPVVYRYHNDPWYADQVNRALAGVGAVIVALLVFWCYVVYQRSARDSSVKADKVIRLMEAQRQNVPHSLTYSPHTAYRNQQEGTHAPPALDAVARPALPVPTFRALLDGGQIGPDSSGRNQPLLLGYGNDGPITGDWKMLYSSGLGGLQGSGKTWTAAYLLAQSALSGARLVVCDPHAGDSESLAQRVDPLAPSFVCDIADDEQSILHALKLADDELQARKKGKPDRTPLIVAIDEWSSLRRGPLADVLPLFVEDFSTEGRKLNCHVMLLGQRWDKGSVGDFRNTLASSYVHRMRPDEARMMTGLRASVLPDDTLQLAPGTAYLLDTYGRLQRVSIPLMTPADLEIVGQRLGDAPSRSPSEVRPFGFHVPHREGATEGATEGGHQKPLPRRQNAAKLTPEEARIVERFNQGVSITELAEEIAGAKGGRAYTDAARRVAEVLRKVTRTQGGQS